MIQRKRTDMTLNKALDLAISEQEIAPKQWEEAEKKILAAGLCPNCAQDGDRCKLGRHEAATADSYAGRACMTCETFYPDARQPRFETEPDYGDTFDGLNMVYSDADPGL